METVKEFVMTQAEHDQLKERLDYLKNEKSREIAERLNVARGYGDLSENSEYDAAKEEQAQNHEAIKALEERLKYAKVVSEENIDYSTVGVGVTVKLMFCDTGDEELYTITGLAGANPFENKISNESPIAKAILGKQVGDVVQVVPLTGEEDAYEMKILEIIKKK